MSVMSGSSWDSVRVRWRECYNDITVVTVAVSGTLRSSFSADTGMAECLFVARRAPCHNSDGDSGSQQRAVFVILSQQAQSTIAAELIAAEITRLPRIRRGAAARRCWRRYPPLDRRRFIWCCIDAPLPQSGPWSLAGLEDGELAWTAFHLERGDLPQVGQPGAPHLALPITQLGNLADRGPVHRDINGRTPNGSPRGPFELIKPSVSPVPTYPMLWAHDAKRERRLVIAPDSEGQIRSPSVGINPGQSTGESGPYLGNDIARSLQPRFTVQVAITHCSDDRPPMHWWDGLAIGHL